MDLRLWQHCILEIVRTVFLIGHPLQHNLSSLTDAEIENKLIELTRKYYQCMRLSPGAVTQVLLLMEDYRNEQQRRLSTKDQQLNTDTDLNDLIKVN